MLATFAEDEEIMPADTSIENSTERLQTAINAVNNWTQKWCINVNG